VVPFPAGAILSEAVAGFTVAVEPLIVPVLAPLETWAALPATRGSFVVAEARSAAVAHLRVGKPDFASFTRETDLDAKQSVLPWVDRSHFGGLPPLRGAARVLLVAVLADFGMGRSRLAALVPLRGAVLLAAATLVVSWIVGLRLAAVVPLGGAVALPAAKMELLWMSGFDFASLTRSIVREAKESVLPRVDRFHEAGLCSAAVAVDLGVLAVAEGLQHCNLQLDA
jgi:hypothetical protein